MPLLIDGFNLIYKFPPLEALMYEGRLNEARKGLLDLLKYYQKIKKIAVVRVVFDGRKEPSHSTRSERIGTIDVYYSLDYSADFLIKEFIKKDLNPKMTTVVTSDKDILFYVARFKAKVAKSEEFAETVNRAIKEFEEERKVEKEDDPVVSEEEITFWERVFKSKKK